MQSSAIPGAIQAISHIGNEFHKAGVLGSPVILEMYRLTRHFDIIHSLETGCGKSTLLFSQISNSHLCFTLGGSATDGDGSLVAVRQSALFNQDGVKFVEGPTQLTLPAFQFDRKFQVIFIDGPHGFPFPNIEYYFLYPHLEEGGLLILDDIHIPTITQLYDFLREDDMFEHIRNVSTTAFFRRTGAELFDPLGDGWWLQQYNIRHLSSTPGGLKRKVHDLLAKSFGVAFAEKVRTRYASLRRR